MIVLRPVVRLATARPMAACAALGTILVAPGAVQARCVVDVAGFVCTGADPDGVVDPRPGIRGDVRSGAEVRGEGSSAQAAVQVQDRATVINEGLIIG